MKKSQELDAIKIAVNEGLGNYFKSDACEAQMRKLVEHIVEDFADKMLEDFGIDPEGNGITVKDGMISRANARSVLLWGSKTKARCEKASNHAFLVTVAIAVAGLITAFWDGIKIKIGG